MCQKIIFIIFINLIIGVKFSYSEDLTSITGPTTQILQRADVLNTQYQAGMGIVKFAPNQIKPSQVQYGPELIYVVAGTINYIAKGKPEKIFKAGDSYQIPIGEIHYSKAGYQGATVVATWVLEKGKPFAKLVK